MTLFECVRESDSTRLELAVLACVSFIPVRSFGKQFHLGFYIQMLRVYSKFMCYVPSFCISTFLFLLKICLTFFNNHGGSTTGKQVRHAK